jgi:hypothetical protein
MDQAKNGPGRAVALRSVALPEGGDCSVICLATGGKRFCGVKAVSPPPRMAVSSATRERQERPVGFIYCLVEDTNAARDLARTFTCQCDVMNQDSFCQICIFL